MLLYGKPVVAKLRDQQAARIAASGITPRLAIIQAGSDLASTTYIKMKQRYGQSIGARVDHHTTASELAALRTLIQTLNNDASVHGIILQLPLPDTTITEQAVALIDPDKDVDGLGGHARFQSATAMAVLQLLSAYHIELAGQPVAMVGHGRLVGAPLARLLTQRDATVSVCDEHTADVPAITRAATIIISATGVAGLIKPDMVQDGAVVVDVGTAEDSGAIVGDVDPRLLNNQTLKISPAKGGVGPVTVAMLFEQLLTAAAI
ncbi:MAG TPA: bifunctional 5,10-methylenetetrahydrofolate dehydrogenase/5,10-methenyltetrahydrofolate cyclohydrolase [Candidatus Saccharimonadales bacterium]|nr:bifunctional 5,10-methylenetetrahydrofolate dehydrogenase/5,10-methenyltetrahydrofolate cyclohydrolase [Candidatus Saccharimonadales bacterium]